MYLYIFRPQHAAGNGGFFPTNNTILIVLEQLNLICICNFQHFIYKTGKALRRAMRAHLLFSSALCSRLKYCNNYACSNDLIFLASNMPPSRRAQINASTVSGTESQLLLMFRLICLADSQVCSGLTVNNSAFISRTS